MAEKRYFWLKLPKDFFQSKEIKRLRRIAGGDTYTIIYLKLLLKSLDTDGKLYFEGIEDNFADEISLDIDEDPDNVQVTINYLLSKGLMTMSDTEAYMEKYSVMVGSESESAERVRRFRERQKEKMLQSNGKTLHCNDHVTPQLQSSNVDKDIDIDKDIDTDKEKEIEQKKLKRKHFTPPTLEEVQAYVTEKGYSVDPERFISYYESNGWMVGRNHMKDWKATVRNWNARERPGGGYQKPYKTAKQAASEETYNFYMKQILEGEDEPEGNGGNNHEDVWGMAR